MILFEASPEFQLHNAFDICMRFHDASLNDLKVIERTRWRQNFVMDKVPREITQKV